MSQQLKNSVFVFLGGALWGIVSLFVTPLSRGGLSSMQISLIREVMAALALILAGIILLTVAVRRKDIHGRQQKNPDDSLIPE